MNVRRLEKEAGDFRREIEEIVADWNEQERVEFEEDKEFRDGEAPKLHTVPEYLVEALDQPSNNGFLPLIFAALDLPADPWPELQTHADLARLIGKGRIREAKRCGLRIMDEMRAHDKLSLKDKLAASIHRDWLVEGGPKNAAKKQRPTVIWL